MATAFENLAARVVRDLMAALHITAEQAAGIAGNIQGESRFEAVQEKNPTSGRGGFGWCQWTGPRRVAFENWCKAKGLGLTSYEANLGFLVQELQTSEANTLKHLRLCSTAKAAAETFEHFFERSRDGQRNWPARVAYANRALSLYRAKGAPMSDPTATPITVAPVNPKPFYASTTIIGIAISVAFKVLAVAAPGHVDPAWEGILTGAVPTIISFVGDAIALLGRLRASQPIAGTQVAQAAIQAQADAPQLVGGFPFPFPGLPDLFGSHGDDVASQPPAAASLSIGGGISAFLQLWRLLEANPELKAGLVALVNLVMSHGQKPAPADRPPTYSGL